MRFGVNGSMYECHMKCLHSITVTAYVVLPVYDPILHEITTRQRNVRVRFNYLSFIRSQKSSWSRKTNQQAMLEYHTVLTTLKSMPFKNKAHVMGQMEAVKAGKEKVKIEVDESRLEASSTMKLLGSPSGSKIELQRACRASKQKVLKVVVQN